MTDFVCEHLFLASIAISIVSLVGLIFSRYVSTDAIFRYFILRVLLFIGVFGLPIQILVSILGDANERPTVQVISPAVRIFSAEPTDIQEGVVQSTFQRQDPSTWNLSWRSTLVAMYFVGMSVVAARILIRLTVTIRFLSSCSRINDLEVRELIDRYGLTLSPQVGLLQSSEIQIPSCTWWLRPYLLLPRNLMSSFQTNQLKLILMHELIHIERRDWIVSIGQTWLRTIFWFNPLVHLYSNLLDRDREASCDAIVIRQTNELRNYANTLLNCCELKNMGLRVIRFGFAASIKRRIQMLKYVDQETQPRSKFHIVSLLALTIVLMSSQQFRLATAIGSEAILAKLPLSVSADSKVLCEIHAPKGGRSDDDMLHHFAKMEQLTGRRLGDWVTNQETLISADDPFVNENLIRAEVTHLNLPEGSKLRAEITGTKLNLKPEIDCTKFEIPNGRIKIISEDGVVRAIGRPPESVQDGTLKLTVAVQNDEVNFLVSSQSKDGKAVLTEVDFDTETGRPKGEVQPPHKAVRYQLLAPDSVGDPVRVKMQWIYDVKKLEAASKKAADR